MRLDAVVAWIGGTWACSPRRDRDWARATLATSSLSLAMAVALSILRGYYPAVSGIQQYLNDHVEFQVDNPLLQSDDTPSFSTLIRGSYVATDGHVPQACKFRARPPMVHLCEVRPFVPPEVPALTSGLLQIIDKAQERLVSKGKGHSANIIAAGYRPVREDEIRVSAV